MRALALDLGARRIGVAASDAGGVLASPVGTIQRAPDRATDHARIAATVAEVGAEVVVVGLPLSLSGREGPAASAVTAEVLALERVLSVPVEMFDERFTTVSAERALGQAGLKGRARRRVVDQAAATVLLQAWLDGRPARSGRLPGP